MIIIALDGGLGNQMFEYAFYLAMKNYYKEVEVKLDLSFLNPQMHNGYELQKVFGLHPLICGKRDTLKYSDYWPAHGKFAFPLMFLFKVRKKIFGSRKTFMLQEDPTEYTDVYFRLNRSKNYYLKGVWANPRFFVDSAEQIKEVFSFPAIEDEGNKIWCRKIDNSNSVSIHFRGGDYYKEHFSVMGKEYFDKAIAIIKQRVSDPHFFVFTDDEKNARKVLGTEKNFQYVNNNEKEKSYIDMQLMSRCKHNIIVNSTFSFWGAYLNSNPDKIVLVPHEPAGICKQPYFCEGWNLL